LKTTKRAGWVREGVAGPESISDHMYRMAMLALLSEKDPALDISKSALSPLPSSFCIFRPCAGLPGTDAAGWPGPNPTDV